MACPFARARRSRCRWQQGEFQRSVRPWVEAVLVVVKADDGAAEAWAGALTPTTLRVWAETVADPSLAADARSWRRWPPCPSTSPAHGAHTTDTTGGCSSAARAAGGISTGSRGSSSGAGARVSLEAPRSA